MKACNASVTLTDSGVTKTGTVTYSNFDDGGIDSSQPITETSSFDVSVNVDGGAEGGQICNEATLKGEENCTDCKVKVIIGYDQTQPIYGSDGITIIGYAPIYYEFLCCVPEDQTSSACIDVGAVAIGFQEDDYFTYNAAAWGQKSNNGNVAEILTNNFTTVYPSGVEIGIPGTSGKSIKITEAKYIYGFKIGPPPTPPTTVNGFLPSGGGGNPAPLPADLIIPPNATTSSSGTFGEEVLTLELNVKFNDANLLGGNANPSEHFGDLTLCNLVAGSTIGGYTLTATAASNLNGKKVREVLADANTALGGGALPNYIEGTNTNTKFNNFKILVSALNVSFPDGTPSADATAYLCK